MKFFTSGISALVFLVGTPVSLLAIDIEGHSAAANDRFANDPAFIGSSYDWSGVGRALTGTAGKGGHWATMISDNVFLSANHYHPSTGTSLYFYPDNNPASSPVVRSISGGQRVGTTDLWIGHFDEALPSSIKYYNRSSETLTSVTFPISMLADENALVNGITSTSTGYGADKRTSQAVGRNEIEEYYAALTVGSTTAPALLTYDNEPGDTHFVTHEAQLQGGDSGGPLFVDSGGELMLAGINWAITSQPIDIKPGPQQELRHASFYSYVGNFDSDIQTYIDNNPATVVPEPSQLTFCLIGCFALMLYRRK